ncbi:hypothetical protein AAX06_01200 [Moraxella bovoculi]|uniref:Uncharacterized protein n=1 Tax=Moraxella bovoculi TaxID=386891 RepID=A0AAC8PU93_9GAMM|nr:hypothetical protein [Moraxella bovoculi]AKG07028.1 hypothetical protein AAX06_01200 [Moraxella bovoculi]
MNELTPQEALQAIADGKKLEYKFNKEKDWRIFRPLDNGVTIGDVLVRRFIFRLAQEMITVGDVSFPKPESEPLEVGTVYWVTAPTHQYYSSITTFIWGNGRDDKRYLQRGFVHLTRDAAIQHAKALVKLSGGSIDAE